MNVVLFGATGMVGQGALRECLLDDGVARVLAVGRHSCGTQHAKLTEALHQDFTDFSPLEGRFHGYDACLFCLGVSSVGMSESEYRRITYGYTLAAAHTLARASSGFSFIYVSGMGTNPQGRAMWARVKGETEAALLRTPFRSAYMFRPGFIQPLRGIRPRTFSHRAAYALMQPFAPGLVRRFPGLFTTTERLGRAMLNAASHGAPKPILESRDINALVDAY